MRKPCQPQHHRRDTRECSSSLLQTATTSNFPIQSPASKLSGKYGADQDKNNYIQQVPLCQMIVTCYGATALARTAARKCRNLNAVLYAEEAALPRVNFLCKQRSADSPGGEEMPTETLWLACRSVMK